MQFSIARLLLVTLFVNFVLAATFALPGAISYVVLTFVSLIVIPPFIVVGVVNTRGIRQAFFLGAMVTGIPHFIFTVYYGALIAFSMASGDSADWASLFDDADELGAMAYLHPIGYLLGAIGGGCGMAAFGFLRFGEPSKDPQSMNSKVAVMAVEKHPTSIGDDQEFRSAEPVESFELKSSQALPPR